MVAIFVGDRATGQILQIAAQGQALTEARVVVEDLTTPEVCWFKKSLL